MSISKIESALISVYHKDGLEPIVRKLEKEGVKIYSTGGTLKFIRNLGIDAIAVEETIGFPEILDGRVKTLHPAIFGGILARRANPTDMLQLQQHNIPTYDLVIVDLYPFEATVAETDNESEIIEKIDIGGISLIRATAKNFNDTLIVSDRNQYADLLQILESNGAGSTLAERKLFATKAFLTSSHYDTAIFKYFNQDNLVDAFKVDISRSKELRYGENPHQKGNFYGDLTEVFETLNGKELSYNNLVDVEASLNLIAEFNDEPTFAVIKHTNACGLATRNTLAEAYSAALAGDPVSAFGGVLACNKEVDLETAKLLNDLFFEVLSAPSYTTEALELLKSKKNRIILKVLNFRVPQKMFKGLLNGVLVQDMDLKTESVQDFQDVTQKIASDQEKNDLVFAIKAVKHLKSNGITLVKDSQLIGMGCGQTSRVDALESAIKKAKQFGFDVSGSVMASEAFFPFPDCVQIAAAAGISAIAQPGGSIRDKDSIEESDKLGVAMTLTGIRHFKH